MPTQNLNLSAQVTTTSLSQTITALFNSAGTAISYTQPTSGVAIGNIGAGTAQYRIDNGDWIVLDKGESNYLPVDLSVNRVLVKLINDGATTTQLDILAESLPSAYIGPSGELFPVANPPVRINGYRYSGAVATAVPGVGYSFTAGQWFRNGVAISGQTAVTYTRTDADIGATISFTPTGVPFNASAGLTLPTLASGGGGAAYLGITATRNALPNTYASTGAVKYMQNKVKKTADTAVPQVEMWFTNITPVGTAEIPGGLGTMSGTIDSASIEYPPGTFTRATFDGAQVGTFVGGPQILKAIAPVAIPEGAIYYEWSLCNWTSTYSPNYSDGMNSSINPLANVSGEMSQTSTSPLTDYTMTGTGMTNTAFQGTSYRAAAHVGMTTKTSYFMPGDSKGRAALSWDSNLDATGFKGEVGRGLEKRAALMNLCVNGDSYNNVTTDGAYLIRAQFAALCNEAIDCLGTNDLGTSATISKAQWESYIAQFKAKVNWGSKPWRKATITARATTTDNGMTTTNQTPVASNASRIVLNDALRAGTMAGVTGYIEIADAVETARNSGILIVPPGARVITDAQAFSSNGINSTATNWTTADIGKLVLGQSGGAAVITNLQTAVLARASSFFGTFGPNGTAYVGIPAFGPPGSDLLHLSPAMEVIIANSSAFDFAGPVRR